MTRAVVLDSWWLTFVKNWNSVDFLTSSDGLSSDLIAIELFGEIISLQKRFTIEKCDPKSVLEYIICRNKLIELYPNTYVILRILLTLSVTAATAERSFSKLKILKNYLR